MPERLDLAARYGTPIVTRDRIDRRRKIHLPWKEHYFRHRVAAIRAAAGIDFEAKDFAMAVVRRAATPI